MLSLESPVDNLSGIGPSLLPKLHKLGIITTKDLLYHFPVRYQDSTQVQTIDQVQAGDQVTITGYLTGFHSKNISAGRTLQFATFSDETGSIKVTWFNQPFLKNTLKPDVPINLSGKVKLYRGNLSLSAPQYELLSAANYSNQIPIHTGRLVPIYPLTSGISQKQLRRHIFNALKATQPLPDHLPASIITNNQFASLTDSLSQIHFPDSQQELNQARERLSFDELFLYQLVSQTIKSEWQQGQTAPQLKPHQDEINQLIESLPFTLTPDQTASYQHIIADLNTTQPMHRLLQGDVGSGKTIVAAIAAYTCSLNHKTCLIMAPTEVLAKQHFHTLTQLFQPYDLSLSLHTSSEKNQPTDTNILVGTHALLHRTLPNNIGLIIIDEQHRFGVNQRAQLLNQPQTPHLLSMTATPIPRTIALTLYAQLDISTITTMPQGRKPVKTWLIPESKHTKSYQWIREQITTHNAQIYYVCPLIQDSTTPKLDQVKAAETQYQLLSKKIFPDLNVQLLHGRMSAKEKTTILNNFRAGECHILVTTPVIEVGVDVKNASIIVIESADRFGLASLHQLRGRVGRSDKQSYCLLFTSSPNASRERLKHLETTHSGHQLAQIDLDIRGPGHLFGTQQSGYIDLKIASLTDLDLIQTTHTQATQLLKQDPQLAHHPQLKTELKQLLEKSRLAD